MARQKGEEDLSDREVEVLDLTDEWHDSTPGDKAYGMSLIEYIADELSISHKDAQLAIYGPPRADGAVL